jgi:hypothetical protein
MALDPSIYRLFAPKSVNEYQSERLALESAQQGQQMNALQLLSGRRKMEQEDRAREEQNALARLMAGGFDRRAPDAQQRLYQTAPNLAPGVQKQWLEQDKGEADLKKTGAETKKIGVDTQDNEYKLARAKTQAIYDATSAATDPASYAMALRGLQASGIDVSQIPQQFDPAFVAQTRQQALTELQRLDVADKAEQRRLTGARDAESARAHRANEATARGQLGVAQGNLGVSRERLNLDRAAPRGVLDPERGLLVDPRTGEARPITVGGQPVGAKADTKPTTEGERVAGGYLLRMQRADELVNQFEKEGRPSLAVEAAAKVGGATGRRMVTGEVSQKYRQAQEDWVRAKLRKESGAVIAADEMDREIETYFPQPGEGERVAKQKAAARKTAEEAMTLSAGRATPKPAGAPKAGTVQGGYRFKGGDPADKANWERI